MLLTLYLHDFTPYNPLYLLDYVSYVLTLYLPDYVSYVLTLYLPDYVVFVIHLDHILFVKLNLYIMAQVIKVSQTRLNLQK